MTEAIVAALITGALGLAAGWLGGLRAALVGADRALANQRALERDRREQAEQDLRAALLAELRMNRDVLFNAAKIDVVARIRTTAWDACVGHPFAEREWKGLVDAYGRLALYDAVAFHVQRLDMPGIIAGYKESKALAKERAEASLSYVEYAITVLEGRG